MSDPTRQHREVSRPWQPRFSITAMLLIMLVVSVLAAGASYLVRSNHSDRASQLAFILFTLAAPLLLVVLVSLGRAILRWLR